MRGIIVAAAILFALVAQHPAEAQVRPVTPPRRDTVRPRPDTARRDTTGADTTKTRDLVKWNETDSVMDALMKRPGYTATRYQGDVVVFNARTRSLSLKGSKAAVNRDQTVLVGDSIIYNDSTKIMVARGDTVILRDPERQTADVIARGEMAYNVELHRGVVTNISTVGRVGREVVRARKAGGVRERHARAAERPRSTPATASITSCDDSIPDYHFQAKEDQDDLQEHHGGAAGGALHRRRSGDVAAVHLPGHALGPA